MSIKVLDCTLRDGAYVNNAEFGASAIKGIINKLQNAGIDFIECGWLKNNSHIEGTSFFHVPADLEQYLTNKHRELTYAAMIDWDRYDLSNLPEYDGKSIDAIRVVFPHGKHRQGVEIGRQIKEKGYKVFFQAANTLAYSDDDLIDLAKTVNSVNPVSLSVVDTFGAMYEEDLERIVRVLDKELDPSIQLGFHSHNNQQLSYALSMHFVKLLNNSCRGCIVDSSLCGMGRGAGNATTELVVSYLNGKCGCHYDMDSIMDAIDIYMGYFMEHYNWGYSTPYFIAGLYCCHVNNIAYLLNNHRTNAKDMRNIIESLDPEDRKKYDYDILEQKYIQNQNHYLDDATSIAELKESFFNRKIILIAPGKTSLSENEKIKEYIRENKCIVIGVNAILPGYDYDYVLFVNGARYTYAKETNEEAFNKYKRIVLSNIKTNADENEFIISFGSVIKRGWVHYDNAVICSLRLMERIGVDNIAIAGFDGFKSQYNESYADPFMPSLNPENKWHELNEEIYSIFSDFRKSSAVCKNIYFVTPSLFEA